MHWRLLGSGSFATFARVSVFEQWPFFVAGYLLGSVPTGLLVGKARGTDIRKAGSGNIGATNTFRVLGKKAGSFVLGMDALKGFAAAALLPWLAERTSGGVVTPDAREWVAILCGFAAILGHNFPCWLRFRGGKGIATSAGVLAALVPVGLAIVLGIWGIVAALTRYVSLASIMAAATLPAAVWFAGRSGRMIAVGALFGALAIYKHRTNIRRLLDGTESRIGRKEKP